MRSWLKVAAAVTLVVLCSALLERPDLREAAAAPPAPAAATAPVLGLWKNLSKTPANSGHPKVAVSGQQVTVVWADRGLGSNLRIYYSHGDNGASPGGARPLSSLEEADYPAIAVSGNDVYVVWEESTPPLGNREIMLAVSRDNGGTFGAPFAISQTAGDSLYPRIAVAGPYVWVIWSDLNGDRAGLNLARSYDSGRTFSGQRLGPSAVPWQNDVAAAGRYGYVVANNHDLASGDYFVRLWHGSYINDKGGFMLSGSNLMTQTISYGTDVGSPRPESRFMPSGGHASIQGQ